MTKPILIAAGVCLCLLLLSACGDEEAVERSPGPTTPEPTDREVKFERLLSGTNSGVPRDDPTVFMLADQDGWDVLWGMHQSIVEPTTTPPPVDFSSETVFAVFDMQQPTGGYSMEIQEIRRDGRLVIVEALRSSPGAGCITTQALTKPFDIVIAEGTVEGEPRLEVVDVVVDCD